MLTIQSIAFKEKGLIPARYTCDGRDINPPLEFSDVPAEAQSLVLIMDDPDAPGGKWDHWVVFNIPPQTTSVDEGHGPPGISGSGTSGSRSYTGPCPPDKEHRYVFTLYALDASLPLQEGASKDEVLAALKGHVLAQATLTGRYDRQR